ncbi:hypothetical protein EDD27_5941 [Nonomuraea polychroma]|uniref:Uncharacterized protein n=1 Tax=Nonomuraea polychroma TaxID=46176 RepID=A0A438MC29_9ACTN|nr:hypothetical protein EDD27_5941 [Nonomuraea polychroma]
MNGPRRSLRRLLTSGFAWFDLIDSLASLTFNALKGQSDGEC